MSRFKFVAAGLLILGLAWAASKEIPFSHIVIDEKAPQNLWGKGAGDLNGDGRIDLLVGGWVSGGLVWYLNPDWSKSVIDGSSKISTDIEVADIDRDGRQDVAAITAQGAVWYRNPDWTPHRIAGDTLHDIELVDIDADGDLDLIGRNQGAFKGSGGRSLLFYIQDAPASWRRAAREIEDGEGLAAYDLDRDGDPDVAVNRSWCENTGGSPETWPCHVYSTAWSHPHVFISPGDLNGDRRPDLAVAPSELKGSRYRVSWFEAPPNPRGGLWKEHVIEPDVETVVHSLRLADFDRDGRLDVAAASMSSGSGPAEVRINFNLGKGAHWRRQVLAASGSHSMRIVDLNGNGILSLFGANFQSSKVELWLNGLQPPNTR